MIFLGLGSNLPSTYGDRFKNINIALSYLESYGIKILKKSSFYETPSYPNNSEPMFINIVIMVETHLNPIDLHSFSTTFKAKSELGAIDLRRINF